MATLDQLPPDRRAILELVVKRGRRYDEIAETLGMPAPRVRELAREALGSLAPATARGVDPQWRDQVADYVLGQQAGPESTATQGHLKRSEPARAWVGSLLDSLDPLYGNGDRPAIPAPEAPAAPAAEGRRGPLAALRERRSSGARRAESSPGAAGLSPGARAVVRRRRIIGGLLALAAIAGLVLLATQVLGGDDEPEKRAAAPRPPAQQARVLGQAPLQAQRGARGAGTAVIAERGGQRQLLVQATGLRPTRRNQAYEVWLYNSPRDAVSIGGRPTDEEGLFQGAGPLPRNFAEYRFIDVSLESLDEDLERHSGRSALRTPLAEVLRAGAGGAAPGGQGQGGGQP